MIDEEKSKKLFLQYEQQIGDTINDIIRSDQSGATGAELFEILAHVCAHLAGLNVATVAQLNQLPMTYRLSMGLMVARRLKNCVFMEVPRDDLPLQDGFDFRDMMKR